MAVHAAAVHVYIVTSRLEKYFWKVWRHLKSVLIDLIADVLVHESV